MIEFPDSYFEDEVRDGFLVPGMMKRYWAALQEVILVVHETCEKLGISFCAEWGTLLGAVRHGGMIPWDDDIDICMTRPDFERFLETAPNVLPEGYRVFTYRNQDSDNMINQIVACPTMVIDYEQLPRFHGYPYSVVIDLSVLDALPENPEEKRAFRDLVHIIGELKMHIDEGDMQSEAVVCAFDEIERIFGVTLDREQALKRQLYQIMDRTASRFWRQDTAELTESAGFMGRGYRFPSRIHDREVCIPFERIHIMAPAGYEAMLNYEYGSNWMCPQRISGGHSYPVYETILSSIQEKVPLEIRQYKYEPIQIGEAKKKRKLRESLRRELEDSLPLFQEAHEEIRNQVEAGNLEQVEVLFEDCQNLAIRLGTRIEEEQGAGHSTVRILEKYCELVFSLYTQMTAGEIVSREASGIVVLAEYEKRLAESISQDIKEKREVVFIPYKSSFWGTMDGLWRTASADEEVDVHVVPAPYYYKDEFGKAKKDEPHYETDYPENVALTNYEEYPFDVRRPDVIIIQCPYDEYHYGMTIHPFFYAQNLAQYTEHLVYVPPLIMDEISPEDERGRITLRTFCNTPGVTYADHVIVQSEQMKDIYVELLTEFAGEGTKAVWKEKIMGAAFVAGGVPMSGNLGHVDVEVDVPEEWRACVKRADGSQKIVILLHMNASVLFEYGREAVQKLREVMELLRKKQEGFVLLWRPDGSVRELLRKEDADAWGRYRDLMEEYRREKWGIYDDSMDWERAVCFCDAYYGDAGVMSTRCVRLDKPVLIASADFHQYDCKVAQEGSKDGISGFLF